MLCHARRQAADPVYNRIPFRRGRLLEQRVQVLLHRLHFAREHLIQPGAKLLAESRISGCYACQERGLGVLCGRYTLHAEGPPNRSAMLRRDSPAMIAASISARCGCEQVLHVGGMGGYQPLMMRVRCFWYSMVSS